MEIKIKSVCRTNMEATNIRQRGPGGERKSQQDGVHVVRETE